MMMMQNMNQGKPNPMVELGIQTATALGKISGIMNENYDGGEFCKGLLFAKEASNVVFKVGGQLMNKSSDEPVVSQKKLALENRMGM